MWWLQYVSSYVDAKCSLLLGIQVVHHLRAGDRFAQVSPLLGIQVVHHLRKLDMFPALLMLNEVDAVLCVRRSSCPSCYKAGYVSSDAHVE